MENIPHTCRNKLVKFQFDIFIRLGENEEASYGRYESTLAK